MTLRIDYPATEVPARQYHRYFRTTVADVGLICDAQGNLDDAGRRTLANFDANHVEYTDLGVTAYDYMRTVPALGTCECGAVIELARLVNRCKCDRKYRRNGNPL